MPRYTSSSDNSLYPSSILIWLDPQLGQNASRAQSDRNSVPQRSHEYSSGSLTCPPFLPALRVLHAESVYDAAAPEGTVIARMRTRILSGIDILLVLFAAHRDHVKMSLYSKPGVRRCQPATRRRAGRVYAKNSSRMTSKFRWAALRPFSIWPWPGIRYSISRCARVCRLFSSISRLPP